MRGWGGDAMLCDSSMLTGGVHHRGGGAVQCCATVRHRGAGGPFTEEKFNTARESGKISAKTGFELVDM
ncbi:MAG: hypothetical protein KatS3mg101_0187 [Patescibacteria group bacterium]|nr:MAG: hypothetical protein KatS3mg101_0187 [Patescibacteria group bacterium]